MSYLKLQPLGKCPMKTFACSGSFNSAYANELNRILLYPGVTTWTTLDASSQFFPNISYTPTEESFFSKNYSTLDPILNNKLFLLARITGANATTTLILSFQKSYFVANPWNI